MALVVGVIGGLQPSGAATDLGGFYATATAQGLRLTYTVPNFAIVEDIVDVGGPVAQAVVDSGGSRSFASLPYPGEVVMSAPGLFNAGTGQSLPAGYPLYAGASHPATPKQELSDPSGTYLLRAQAAEGRSDALAHLGLPSRDSMSVARNDARTSVVVESDTVTATADTVNEGVALAQGALRIGSVRSRSVTTYRAGDPKGVTKMTFAIEGGSVGDLSFSYGQGGLVVSKQGVPVPISGGLEQLNAALAPAGVALHLVAPQDLKDGGSADALEIVLTPPPPPGAPSGIVKVRLGGATTAVASGQPLPGVGIGVPGSGEPVAVVDPGASGTAPTDSAVSGGTPTATPAATSSGSPTSFGLPATPPEAGAAGDVAQTPSAGDAAGPTGEAALTVPIVKPRPFSSDEFAYGIIILGGVAMMVFASLWRLKGGLAL